MRQSAILGICLALCACGITPNSNDPSPGDSDPGDSPGHARGAWSLFLDGDDDRATVPSVTWGSPSFDAGFTFEAWVLPQQLVASPGWAGIVQATSAHTLALDKHTGDRNQTAFPRTVSVPGTNNAESPLDTLQAGAWQHVAGTFDVAVIRIYRNGSLVGAKDHPGTATTPSEVILGGWTGSFHGYIDEVRIWNVPRS